MFDQPKTATKLAEIIRLHNLWVYGGSGGVRANLSGAVGFILIGQDIRSYLFWATQNNDGVVMILAGCQRFVGIAAARDHWTHRHEYDPILHEDCLSMVDRAERMAKVRGWKLEIGEVEAVSEVVQEAV